MRETHILAFANDAVWIVIDQKSCFAIPVEFIFISYLII